MRSLDGRVAALVAAGDASGAAEEVIRAHGPRVLRYLRGVLRDVDEADDAFSLFAEWTWRGIGRFRGEAPVRIWALCVAWNAARRVLQGTYRRRRVPLASAALARLVHDLRSSDSLRAERAVRQLDRLRARLGPEEQNLLVLRVDQRLAWEEIADVLSIDGEIVTATTLRKRFERVKARIARLAKDLGMID